MSVSIPQQYINLLVAAWMLRKKAATLYIRLSQCSLALGMDHVLLSSTLYPSHHERTLDATSLTCQTHRKHDRTPEEMVFHTACRRLCLS